MRNHLLIIAGEASGDLHGANLVKALKQKSPDLICKGIGGDKMISEGFQAEYHIREMAFLGFAEVVRHLPFIKKVQRDLYKTIVRDDIKTVVLIDYPGFNLSFAKKIRKLGVNIIYYISPQIWAWGQKRIKKIRRLVDEMLVILPFEKKFYENHGVNVEFVGHPLIERLNEYAFLTKEELFDKYKLDPNKEILLLMPGSRKQEVARIFPESIKAAKKIAEKYNLQTVVACPGNIDKHDFETLSDVTDYKVITDRSYDLMKHAKFGIIKSGTSTLEAALFELPFVCVYSTSNVTYRIGKMLVKINNIALANIVLNKNVVHELIQQEVNETNITDKVSEILEDETVYEELKKSLSEIRNLLGTEKASEKASDIIMSFVNGNE